MSRKIGFLSGTFDPPHAGHIALAKAALEAAELDQVYFIPEISPRHKEHALPVKHREAMLRLAISIFPKLSVLQLPDEQLTPGQTVPELQSRFPGAELYYIAGSDILRHLPNWPEVNKLLESMSLIIGLRIGETKMHAVELLTNLPSKPQAHLIKTAYPAVASSTIKADIRTKGHSPDISPAVEDYIKENELYSPGSSDKG